MGNELITQIGVGGILAILILREVFSFLNKKNGDKNDDRSVVLNRQEIERLKNTVQFRDTCSETVKRFDGMLHAQEKRFDRLDHFNETQNKKLNEIWDQIKSKI